MASTQECRGSGLRRSAPAHPNQRPSKRLRRWCDFVEWCALANGLETDKHRIEQRQKQINYGKNTIAYDRFIAVCPREKRKRGDPMTPLARQKCSKRSFLGQVTSWKKKVYSYVAEMDKESDEEKVLDVDDGFKLDGGSGKRSGSEKACSEQSTAERDCVPSSGHSTEDVTDEGDIDFSDLDDIELDDHGNVISKEDDAAPAADKEETEDNDDSPALIFKPY
ncbi:Histone RNA hairpin-binding protein [Gracilariopsis chorda]|uniref:Histone RNA hairpin-binding protein n=1 Tax=Gracilariopsis chorda TaxID=448386 RepID=A0A2V3IUN0_9FLOR|nr:Histone RNA hairpin-binding protein [Gracilariopsis chorda]|eukprot:PXF44840.1 Histone RNA hairpin-binding protein [Gracilariopsis chorda]